MKKANLIVTLFTILLLTTSCEFDKLANLQDDFEISVSAEAVLSKMNIKVFNSKDGSNITETINLSFSGTGSENIYTINGTKNFKIENGLITVGVNRNIVITDDNPLTLTATLSADGYVTKSQEINFDAGDIQEVQVSLMKISDLPETTSVKSVTEGLVNNKTTKEIKIEIPSKKDPSEILEVSIPADTEFYDENGNVMTGTNVRVDFQTFETEAPDENELTNTISNPETLSGGLNEFPGDMELTDNAKTSSKSAFGNGKYLVPIGSLYCIYYYVNGRRVTGVSRPTTFGFIINKNRINPSTGQKVKIGDKITFYRRFRYNSRNTRVGDATITQSWWWWSNNYFYFRMTIPAGPGIYPYGFEVTPSCSNTINNITFKNDNRRTFYLYNVAHKTSPWRAQRWGYMYFDGSYQVNRYNANYWRNRALNMLRDDMILKIYYYSWQDRRFRVIYNKEISKCDLEGQTIDITNPDCYQERDLDLKLECPDATYLLNNTYVYYKKENDRYWGFFDRVRNSRLNGKSPCLESETKYKFGFWYDGWKETPALTEQQMINLYQNFDLPTICNAIKDL